MSTAQAQAPPLSKPVIFGTAGLGGIGGWIVVHPFNTIAVRSSLASTVGKPFSLASMIKKEGPLSVYSGLSAGIARQLVYATSRFGLFETFRDKLHQARGKTDFTGRVSVGAVTGGIAAYLSCPMEVCVVRMSNDATLPVEKQRGYTSVANAGARILKEEGLSAFWRGSTPFVQRAMMVGVFQVATYDQFKTMYAKQFGQKKDSVTNVFCGAMTSGLLYSLVTMPLESMKNRMANQVAGPDGKLPYTGTMQGFRKVVGTEGALALYKGYIAYYGRCGGHTVTMFLFVQILRDFYREYSA